MLSSLLFNTNSSICATFKYSKWLNTSIWLINGTPTDFTILYQSGRGSNGYSTFPKAPRLESHHQMQFSIKSMTVVGGIRLQRCSRCILLPQPTGLKFVCANTFKITKKIQCGVIVKAMDCGIVVSEFVLQSPYNVHFRANTLGKGMNPLILPAMS